MRTIVNFAHPLSNEVLEELKEYAGEEFRVVEVKYEADFNISWQTNINRMLQLVTVPYEQIDLIVAPSLSMLAVGIAKHYHDKSFLALSRVGNTVPPQWGFYDILIA